MRSLLLLLLAACAPTRPMTAHERAQRVELAPPRDPPLREPLQREPAESH